MEQKVGNNHLGEWEREWTRDVTEQRLAHGRCLLNIGRVDGWMAGWMDGRMDGWADAWADACVHEMQDCWAVLSV